MPLWYHKGDACWHLVDSRQLATVSKNGSTYAYTYNADGTRRTKTVNGVTTTYYWLDGVLYGQSNNYGDLVFLYDEQGEMYGFNHNGSTYYYVRNLQGDVIQVVDAGGEAVAAYGYDTWGRLMKSEDGRGNTASAPSSIAQLNPIRYRGYYYDTETGFYYLNSRYYDPNICRFINADTITDGRAGLLGYNLFVYAANDPINNVDPSGRWIVKKAIKWVAKNVIRPAVKKAQEALSAINATYSRGVNISGSPSAFIFNLQGGVSVDTKGNVALQGSFAGGVTGGSPGASITTYQMVTNAQSIKKLEDAGYQMGGSMGIPVYGVPIATGGDFNIIPDTELNKTYLGVTSNVGVGTPGIEFHVEWGETATWRQTQFNVFDSAKTIYVKIMEW